MFAKNKITQSMIDAVNSVISEQSVDEASVKVPTSTGMKVYGGAKGGSANVYKQQKYDDELDKFDEPSNKELKSIEKEKSKNESVRTPFVKRLMNTIRERKGNQPQETFTNNNVGEDVVLESEVVTSADYKIDATTDMLSGRVKGGKSNSFKSFKLQLKTDGEMKAPDVEKGEDTKEKQKISTNPGPVDIKLDDKLTGPTPYSYFKNKTTSNNEEVKPALKAIRNKEVNQRNVEIDDFSKKVVQEEDVENLDELSKKTLAKYTIHAAGNLRKNSIGAYDDIKKGDVDSLEKKINKSNKRQAGIGKAAIKLAYPRNEEVEYYEINEEKPEHTHVAHFENGKGEWMAKLLINAKHDGHAIEQANEATGKGPFGGLKVRKVERVTKVMEEELDKRDIDLSEFTTEDIEQFMQTEDYQNLDESGKNALLSYMSKLVEGQGRSDIPAIIRKTRGDVSLTAAEIKRPNTEPPGKVSAGRFGQRQSPLNRIKSVADIAMKRMKKESMIGSAGATSESVEVLEEGGLLDLYIKSLGFNPETISKDKKIGYANSEAFLKWKQSHIQKK